MREGGGCQPTKPDLAEIKRGVSLLFRPSDVVEVRVPRTKVGADPRSDKSEQAGGFDMRRFLAQHGFKVLREKPWVAHPGVTIYELQQCPFNPDHTQGSAAFNDTETTKR